MTLIDNYFVKKYSSGIVSLVINTKDKWVGFHRYSDTEYKIWKEEEDESVNEEILKIPESELSLDANEMYMKTEAQAKDQIYFYFIPTSLLDMPSKRKREEYDYIIRRLEDNPFDKSECSKNQLFALDTKTFKPIAVVEENKWIKEGMMFKKEEGEIEMLGKKIKHIVVGDTVLFSKNTDFYEGLVTEIKPVKEDEDSWDDLYVLKDCKVREEYQTGELAEIYKSSILPIDTTAVFKKSEIRCKPWPNISFNCPTCKI